MERHQYTIISKKIDFQSVLTYITENFNSNSYHVNKEGSEWDNILLMDQVNEIEIKFVSKRRKQPMDEFSKLVLGLFNQFNKFSITLTK